jgi:hypothetical protein
MMLQIPRRKEVARVAADHEVTTRLQSCNASARGWGICDPVPVLLPGRLLILYVHTTNHQSPINQPVDVGHENMMVP